MWRVEEGEEDEPSETDSPWPTRLEADATRAYHSPYADDNAWLTSVSRKVWNGVVRAWAEVGWADNVLDALGGTAVVVHHTSTSWFACVIGIGGRPARKLRLR